MSVTTQTRDAAVWDGSSAGADAQLPAITSTLLKALIFEIVVIMLNVYGALQMVGTTIAMATEDHFTGVTLYFAYLTDGSALAFLSVCAVLSAVVAIRTWRMLSAANRGDIPGLWKLSSLGWAVVAGVFSLIVPGILLNRANRAIRAIAL